ncbi:MAG TPA: serine/threonine-protein kinase [Kofleriaceae bacterium]
MDEPDETQTVGVAAAVMRKVTSRPDLSELRLPSRFTPLGILGEGAMGFVIEARDETLGRAVAVKLIAPKRLGDAKSRDRFLREARAVATLRHEHIVTVHDLDPHGKFLVMELVRGETLRDRIARDGALGAAEARRIGAALLAALATAHDAGIVHRDVKPANVLLGRDGSLKLADFGVAMTQDSELTNTGEVVGTPVYMAPEQLRGHGSDLRVDLYAAGATVFEVATGQRLHSRPGRADDLRRRITELVPDRNLAEAIAVATREDPTERFVDARAFAAALAARPANARRWWLAAGVLALGATTAGIALSQLRGSPDSATAVVTPDAPSSAAPPASPFERGLAALERQDFVTAESQLRGVADAKSSTRDEAAKAHYYLAILYWWTSRATPDVLAEIDTAIAGGLDARLADVATGVRQLVSLEYPAVIGTFERLQERYPGDRDVLYGAYEAQFHGGYPAKAHAAYRQLRAIAPSFGLGRHHMLGYFASRTDFAPVREFLTGVSGIERARWDARIHAALQRYPEARERLASARTTANERDAAALDWELAAVHAVADDIEAAHTLAVALSAKNMQAGTVPLLGIALARGTVTKTDAIDFLWRLATNAANVPPSILTTTREGWLELAPFIAIDENPTRARAAMEALPHDVDTKMIETALARVLLAGVLRDREAVTRFRASHFPVVAEAAEALLDELAGDRDGAIEHWGRALAKDGFVRFRIALGLRVARLHHAAKRSSAVIASCEFVIRPPVFHWSWGAAIGECLELTAIHRRATGDLARSQAASARIVKLRAAAPASDPLASRARANVSAGRTQP